MSWLLLIPCAVVVALVWRAVLWMALRPWVRLPRFPLSKAKKEEAKAVLRTLRPGVYVLVIGVLEWGWGVFASFTLWDYLRWRYWGITNGYFLMTNGRLSCFGMLWGFLVWSAAGIWFGYASRRRIAR